MRDGLWAITVGSTTFEDFCNDYTSYIEGTSNRFPTSYATFDSPYGTGSDSDSGPDHDPNSNSDSDSDSDAGPDADSDADSDSTDANLSTSSSRAESLTVSELLVECISNSRSELLEKMKHDWKRLCRNACERILFTMDKKINIRYQRFRDPKKLWERLVKDNPECRIDRNRQYKLTSILYSLKLGAPWAVEAYVSKINSLAHLLAKSGRQVSMEEKNFILLRGLSGPWLEVQNKINKNLWADFDWSVRKLFKYESIMVKEKIEAEVEREKQEKQEKLEKLEKLEKFGGKLAKQAEKHRAILESSNWRIPNQNPEPRNNMG
jgi:hypothetical protein